MVAEPEKVIKRYRRRKVNMIRRKERIRGEPEFRVKRREEMSRYWREVKEEGIGKEDIGARREEVGAKKKEIAERKNKVISTL